MVVIANQVKSIFFYLFLILSANAASKKSLGNHEFDNGVPGLTPFIYNLSCPVLAANLILDKEPDLQKETNLKKYFIFDIDNVKVGVVGYLTPETKFLAVKNNVEFTEEIEAIREVVKKLQEDGVNIIIALGHSGFSKDLEIAKEVDGLDLVIGGHSNTFLWNGSTTETENPVDTYPTFVKQNSGKTVPVVQAYAYTKYLGKLHMVFNKKGEAISISGHPILLDKSIQQDPETLDIINRYRDNVEKVTGQLVGTTTVLLEAQTCHIRECNLGNLITDAMVYQYALNYTGNYWTDAPIAIIQGGGIRSSVAQGKITEADLLTVMPFEGILVVLEMNGTVLMEMLEHSVSFYESIDLRGEFLQYSGIKIVYDMDRPAGSRVHSVLVRCGACEIPQYYPLNDDELYRVIMPNFVSNGGDGYTMLVSLKKQLLPYNELFCTKNYIRKHSPIVPEIAGRIQILRKTHQSNSALIVLPLIGQTIMVLLTYLLWHRLLL